MRRTSCHYQHTKEARDEIFALESPNFISETAQSPSLGDFHTNVSIIDYYLDNSLSQKEETIIDTQTETRAYQDMRAIEEIRREARFYASFFDNKRYRNWMGSLMNVLRETPPEAKQYAAIATLFYSYFPLPDGRFVTTPGGFFTNICKQYRQPCAHIPADVQAWHQSGQSLQAMKDALAQGIRHPAQAQLFSLALPDEQQERQEAETQCEAMYPLSLPDRLLSQHLQRRTWMTHDDALHLWGRIKREGRSYHIEAAIISDEEHPQAFVVMVTWDGWQEPMRNEDEWIQYFAHTKDLM